MTKKNILTFSAVVLWFAGLYPAYLQLSNPGQNTNAPDTSNLLGVMFMVLVATAIVYALPVALIYSKKETNLRVIIPLLLLAVVVSGLISWYMAAMFLVG